MGNQKIKEFVNLGGKGGNPAHEVLRANYFGVIKRAPCKVQTNVKEEL